jgi:hypothetical protein
MLFYSLLSILFVAITLCNTQMVEKTVNAVHPYNKTCVDLSKSTKAASKCEFHKCFEDRFPCGMRKIFKKKNNYFSSFSPF